MTVYINGTTGYSGPVGTIGDLTTTGNTTLGDGSGDTLVINGSSTTFTQGTANGVGYLNGSKVFTTGSALTFDGTNLSVVASGNPTLTVKATGSGNDPKIYLTADTNSFILNGAFSPSTDLLEFKYNSSSLMALDSSGNLGIGTTSPAYKLDVVGTVQSTGSGGAKVRLTDNTVSVLNSSAIASGYLSFKRADGTQKAAVGSYYNVADEGNLEFIGPTGSTNMLLNSSGNLGLGVTPSAWQSPFKVIEGGGSGVQSAIGFQSNANAIKVMTNAYYNGSNYIYKNTAAATQLSLQDGTYQFNIAGSGTAGTAISFTQAMTLAASGFLGIGTTSPPYGLTVSDAGGVGFEVGPGSQYSSGKLLLQAYNRSGSAYSQMDYAANTFTWLVNGSERMRLDSSGNLALGTTTANSGGSAAKWLTIGSNAGNTYSGGISFSIGSTNQCWLYQDTDNIFAFQGAGSNAGFKWQFGGTEYARINSSGYLGVGTSAPAFRIDASTAGAVISGTATTGSNMYGIRIYNQTTATSNNAIGLWFATGPHQAGIASFRPDASAGWETALAFYTHSSTTSNLNDCSERMRIDGDGNLLVGGSSPYGKIYARSDNTSFPNLKLQNEASTGYFANFSTNGNSTVGTISFTVGGTAYNTSSDYRLKNTIAPMTGALAKVALLKPCTYKWNADGSDGEGFIAHELAEVCPHAVTGEKDAVNEDGSIKPQGIDTSYLVATLTAAIQELKAELDSVKSELATIKGAV